MTLKKKTRQRVSLIDAYQRLFGSSDGQMVLHDILKSCHLMAGTFVAGDPHETTWREGQRSVALRIIGMMKIDSKKLLAQIKEHERLANDDE